MFAKYLVVLILFIKQGYTYGEVKFKDLHHELPPLYSFDDYDRCFLLAGSKVEELPSGTYCVVFAEIQEDNSNELWQQIAKHNEFMYNYRSDRLFFGLCLNRCMKFVNGNFSEQNVTINNDITQFFEMVHQQPLDLEMRTNYSRMIQQCLNDEFQRKYNLELKTFVEYCERRQGDVHNMPAENGNTRKDVADTFVYKFFEVIILLCILSTFCDYFIKYKHAKAAAATQGNHFFKTNLQKPAWRLITSFSLTRNYYRLTQPYRGEVGQRFAYLDGLRSVCTLMILCCHSHYISFGPVKNTEFFENFGKSTLGLMALNMSIIIEIYMVMSGILLHVKFAQRHPVTPQSNFGKCWNTFWAIIIGRYVRFLPTLVAIIGVNVTFLKSLGDGPFWRHLTEPARTFGRKNWWKNLLMINNFSPKDTSSPHTWYLAVNFQLCALYTIILIIMSKYPQYKKRIFIIMGFLTIAISTSIAYIFKLEPAYMNKPETYRYGFVKDYELYYLSYTPFYTNLGGYLFGLLCGEIYLKFFANETKSKKLQTMLQYLWPVVPLTAWYIYYLGTILIFHEPSLWTALYSGLHRNIWILIVCGIPVMSMACNAESLVSKFCRLPMFRIFARLTPQAFMWHCLVLQVTTAYHRQPQYITATYYACQCIITIGLSTILAFFGYLLLEIPFSQIFEALLPQAKKKR
ncbi:nose resistant to fluoxetine protein 6-like [Musca autumnalis]|uniref:nose resistant to fluoxetine protein 6-like n=1 Tax=Musca autumnalis TaxID=221902 RepID=UPI003CF8D371